MSLPEYVEVAHAASRVDFKRSLERLTRQKGFDHFSAMTVNSRGGSRVVSVVDDVPQDYAVHYHDPCAGQIDPILKHLSASRMPIIWCQDTYVRAGLAELWELQAPFGYRTGIAMALHMPDGKHFLLGVDRSDPLPKEDSQLTRMIADLQLLAVYAQKTAVRVLSDEVAASDPV